MMSVKVNRMSVAILPTEGGGTESAEVAGTHSNMKANITSTGSDKQYPTRTIYSNGWNQSQV